MVAAQAKANKKPGLFGSMFSRPGTVLLLLLLLLS